MNRSSIISKSMGYLLLVVMTYNFFCSAFCAVSTDGCCGKEEKEHHDKSCCSNENDSDEKKNDCQDKHLAFFKTLGQFVSEKSIDATKVLHTIVAMVISVFNLPPVSENKSPLAFNGFHPPPPKGDIRIFIQSFQI